MKKNYLNGKQLRLNRENFNSEANTKLKITPDLRIHKPTALAVIKRRVQRSNEDELLEEATAKNNFEYWLSQEDIADIARLVYNNFNGHNFKFEILKEISHLGNEIEKFQLHQNLLAIGRLTLIINLPNLHWVTLVIFYKNNVYEGYYVDSKNDPLPREYYNLLEHFKILPMSVSPGFAQQSDGHNCGLFALENAADICQMLDQNQSTYWLVEQLKKTRDKDYFKRRRKFLSEILRTDSERCERHQLSSFNEPHSKRARLQLQEEKTELFVLLDVYVESFMATFMKKIGAYHLTAKGDRLTEDSLKTELKTGITGGILGVALSQSIVGAIPSLVTTLRLLSSKYYLSKDKAQKITKFFSNIDPDVLSEILSEAAVDIFFSFESQFALIDDKAGKKIAMEKLADDAVERAFNYIFKNLNDEQHITKEIIEKGILLGPSEKFFDPNISPARIRVLGNIINDQYGKDINTANLYENIGLIISNSETGKFYKNRLKSFAYGYRKPLHWEKEETDEIEAIIKKDYEEISPFNQKETLFQFASRNYNYVLRDSSNQQEARGILNKIRNRNFIEKKIITTKGSIKKDSILFNLKKPIKNFVGRENILFELHKILTKNKSFAVISSFINLMNLNSAIPESGSQLSISGLGGVGKTQLALQYAKLFSSEYDHNILWMNCETKENIDDSFKKLANKINIDIYDRYGQAKFTTDIAEEIYEFFSDKKSLFILDNVEDYKKIEIYLPKTLLGNSPTILITSRFTNWKNVAEVFMLNVFKEEESFELVKKTLNSNFDTNEEIKELHHLLQGLPLALQQALAYIKLRNDGNEKFNILNYIDLFKEKTKELLEFNFSDYSNDPYLKTVYITWQVTLDKVLNYPDFGKDTINILNIISYLDPDNITSDIFYSLKKSGYSKIDAHIDLCLNLLVRYSIISVNDQNKKYSIHRLVQQVIRIIVENDNNLFIKTIEEIQKIFIYHKFSDETDTNLLYFLFHMSAHKGLKNLLIFGETSRMLFSKLLDKDIKFWHFFLDLSYLKFKKQKYFEFLGDALTFCIKKSSLFFLSETLNHMEIKYKNNKLSKENIKYILEYMKTIDFFWNQRLSRKPEKRKLQIEVAKLLYLFKEKIFEDIMFYYACSLKRTIKSCLIHEQQEYFKIIRNKKLAAINKISCVSRWISSGLLTKDTFSALFQGDYSTVAINFGLVTSSQLLGEMSETLFRQGEILTTDSLINKAAFNIFLNEEILPSNKRRFLGTTMKVASPYIAKGTSIFFAYNFIDEIKAYKAGNNALLSDIITNGVIVGIDLGEATIEASEILGFTTEISGFTGPVGEGIALAAWLISDINHAKQQIEAIEKYVPLSGTEEFVQGLRAFFLMPPSEYLMVKANNNRLIERAINFLKLHTSIKSYVFPTFHSSTILYEQNEMLWNEKRTLIVDSHSETMNKGRLFCVDNYALENPCELADIQKKLIYNCRNAIGVEYTLNRTNNITLVSLQEGEDSVIIDPMTPTIFLVQNGKKMYKGGDKGNLFILEGEAITGSLQGGKGTNILRLNNFNPKESDYLLIDSFESLCAQKNDTQVYIPLLCPANNSIQLYNINQIYGRKNLQEIIFLSQAICIIDGYGGKDKEQPDYFFIENNYCKKLKLTLRNNTFVLFSKNANVDYAEYFIPIIETGEASVQFQFTEAMQQKFFFDSNLETLKDIRINNQSIIFFLSENSLISTNNEIFQLTIIGKNYDGLNKNLTKNSIMSSNILIYFKDVEIKFLNKNWIYGKEIKDNHLTLDKKIHYFLKITDCLGKAFSIQLSNNITLAIGQGKHEIMYTNGIFESHLIGQGGENVYVVLPGKNTKFPLPGITLYDISKESQYDLIELADTLDLRGIVKKTKQICQHELIFFNVTSLSKDLNLNLFADCPSNMLIANITLKNAMINNYYQKLDIFLADNTPMNIIATEDQNFIISSYPLIFNEDKEIIVIMEKDISMDTKIVMLIKIEDYNFFRYESDLLLSNIFFSPNDYCTLIFYEFYKNLEMKNKTLAIKLIFFDKTILFKNNLEKIKHAFDYPEAVRAYYGFEPLNATVRNDASLESINQKNTIQLPINRSKRQINHKKSTQLIQTKYNPKYKIKSLKNKKKPKKGLILNECLLERSQTHQEKITCYTEKMRMMIFFKSSNIKLRTLEDAYSKYSCRSIEFEGQQSVFCEGKKTNIVYTPKMFPSTLEQFNNQLALFQVLLHEGKKIYNWAYNLFFREKKTETQSFNNHTQIIKQKNKCKASIRNIEMLITNLEDADKNKLQWARNILVDIKGEFEYLISTSQLSLKKLRTFNKNLDALEEELEITRNMVETFNLYNLKSVSRIPPFQSWINQVFFNPEPKSIKPILSTNKSMNLTHN